MRFHHSTRRGRNRLYQHRAATSGAPNHPTSTSRWSQLGYCRDTNIHFNRRLPIEPPPSSASERLEAIMNQQPQKHSDQLQKQMHKVGKLHSLELPRMPEADISLKDDAGGASPDSGTSGLLQEQLHLGAGLDRLALSDSEPALASRSPQNQKTKAGRDMKLTSADQQQQLIDIESARQRLVAKVEKHRFWSNKAARRMKLNGIEQRSIYIYELVSFCERRDLEWRYEPYRGGAVPSIPFRRQDAVSPAASSADSPALRNIRVPRPQYMTNLDSAAGTTVASGDSLNWSLDSERQSTGRHSSIARLSHSNANSPTRTSAAVSNYKPISAMEHKLPNAEFVWSIEAPAHLKPEPFVGQLHTIELAGSSFVKRCHGCQGRGRLKCASCYGVGYEVCISCSGRGITKNQAAALGGGSRINDRYASRNSTNANGYDDGVDLDYRGSSSSSGKDSRSRGNEPGGISGGSSSVSSGAWLTESCHFCHGAGQKRCWVCAGKSFNYCQGCQGLGQLRCYLNLNITWTNHRDESILNNSDNIIPKERLRLCSGLLLAEESGEPKLRALNRAQIDGATGCPEDSNLLNLASKRLLDKHYQTYRHERLIKQRHKVTQIQCHIVNYEWKHRRGHFVIYGDERKVYIAKYPFKSICNIT